MISDITLSAIVSSMKWVHHKFRCIVLQLIAVITFLLKFRTDFIISYTSCYYFNYYYYFQDYNFLLTFFLLILFLSKFDLKTFLFAGTFDFFDYSDSLTFLVGFAQVVLFFPVFRCVSIFLFFNEKIYSWAKSCRIRTISISIHVEPCNCLNVYHHSVF